jgi:hypothetical protein
MGANKPKNIGLFEIYVFTVTLNKLSLVFRVSPLASVDKAARPARIWALAPCPRLQKKEIK